MTKEENFRKEALNEMFKRVGFDGFDQKFVDANSNWYRQKTWTEAEQTDFKKWLVKKYQKTFNSNKKLAEGEVGWFLLHCGWKIDFD